jgi:hypothetical protein
VGRDEQMNLDQPEELTEQERLSEGLINSRMNLNQQMQLTERRKIRMIFWWLGEFQVFLPFAQEEAENSVVDGATTKEQSQLEMTVEEEELEQTLGAAQAEEENEHSVECLNTFSQEAESVVALELTAEKSGGREWAFWGMAQRIQHWSWRDCNRGVCSRRWRRWNEHSEEWLDIFSQEAENTATEEVAEAEKEGREQTTLCFADLWDQLEALEERVKVQGRHIQQVKLETNEEGRHGRSWWSAQWPKIFAAEETAWTRPATGAAGWSDRGHQGADVEVSRHCQQGEAEQKKRSSSSSRSSKQQQQEDGADGKLQRLIWDPGGFPTATGEAHEQELMIFAAVEYDAGASLHAASQPASHVSAHAFRVEREAQPHLNLNWM